MKSEKRLNKKVAKRYLTKKRRQVGRGKEEYTITMTNPISGGPVNYIISIENNKITGPPDIIPKDGIMVIEGIDNYISQNLKTRPSVDLTTLLIGRDKDGGKLKFVLYTYGREIIPLKPGTKGTIVIDDEYIFDNLLINELSLTHETHNALDKRGTISRSRRPGAFRRNPTLPKSDPLTLRDERPYRPYNNPKGPIVTAVANEKLYSKVKPRASRLKENMMKNMSNPLPVLPPPLPPKIKGPQKETPVRNNITYADLNVNAMTRKKSESKPVKSNTLYSQIQPNKK